MFALLGGARTAHATTYTYAFSGVVDYAFDQYNGSDPFCNSGCPTTFSGSVTFDLAPDSSVVTTYTGTIHRYNGPASLRSFVVDWGSLHLEWDGGFPLQVKVQDAGTYSVTDTALFDSYSSTGSYSYPGGPGTAFGWTTLGFSGPSTTFSGEDPINAASFGAGPGSGLFGEFRLSACHLPEPHPTFGWVCGEGLYPAFAELEMEGTLTSWTLVSVPEPDLRAALLLFVGLTVAMRLRSFRA